MSPVYSLDDVECVIYDTSGRIASFYEYGCDVYANAIEKLLSNTTACEETIFRVLGT